METPCQIPVYTPVPHPEEITTVKMANFCSGTIELQMRENSSFLVPVKFTFVCRAPVLGHNLSLSQSLAQLTSY